MWKQMRRKAVCFFVAAVCSGVCGWLFPAAGMWAEPVSGQEEVVSGQEEAAPMDTSWMDREVAVALDENNMDENGNTYILSSGTERTARMWKVHVKNGQDRKADIQIRVPDKVVKEGKVYVVTDIHVMLDNPGETIRADISFLCGKEVRDITWDSMPCASVCYPHE